MDLSTLNLPPAIIAALITSFAAVICVPIINRILTQHFDKRSRISVSYNVFDANLSKYVTKLFGNVFDRSVPEPDRTIRFILSHLKGYVKLEIVNEGSVTVKNINIYSENDFNNAVAEIDGCDETFIVDSKNPLKLGDLQPKLKKIIHLYADAGSLAFKADSFLRSFNVSADHIDRIKYMKGNSELIPMQTMLKRMQYAFYLLLVWFLVTSATYIPQIVRNYLH